MAAGMVSLPSCDSYFDDVPNNATTLDDIFQNRGQALGWLTNIYSFYPDCTNRYAGNTAMYWNGGTIEDVKTGLLTFLNFVHEYTCRLESGYLVFGNDDSGFLGNVSRSFFAASLDDKTTKSAEVNVFARS